jgi:hypothetical protein
VALIQLRTTKVAFTKAQISIAPVDFTADDVEKHLTLPDDSKYFSDMGVKAGELFKNGAEPIVYKFAIAEDAESRTATLTVKTSDVAFSNIEFNLVKTTFGKGTNQSEGFRISSWQIK